MAEEQNSKIREELLINQYNRASEDSRHFDQLIWQIPSVGITVTSVVFAASFGFVKTNQLIMGIVLLLGSTFQFALMVALTKYRLMQDVRAHWMETIENNFGIVPIPVSTERAERFF